MSNSKNALILFAKSPRLGGVKTRISTSLGKEKALAIYEQLLKLNCDLCSSFNGSKYIFWDQIPEGAWSEMRQNFKFVLQLGTDLGKKMENAFSHLFKQGYQKIILIGTDCPYLSMEDLERAFAVLSKQELVLGPAEDGGYYMIGMKSLHPSLFEGISWSTSKVLAQTIHKLETRGVSFELLPTYSDIDTEKDYQRWLDTFTS